MSERHFTVTVRMIKVQAPIYFTDKQLMDHLQLIERCIDETLAGLEKDLQLSVDSKLRLEVSQ